MDITQTTDVTLTEVTLCHVSNTTSSLTPEVDFTLKITEDFSWSLFFHNHRIERDNCSALLSSESTLRSPAAVTLLINLITSCTICIGNPDDRFTSLAHSRQGVFMDPHGVRVVARNDTKSFAKPTIRHSTCQILLPNDNHSRSSRCMQCHGYRATLRVLVSRRTNTSSSKDPTNPHSRTAFKHLDKESLTSRLRQLSTLHNSTNLKMKVIQAKLEKVLKRDSVTVDQDVNSHLMGIMQSQKSHISAKYPEGSFPRIFWEQQLKAASMSNTRGMRWHPLIIKWALYLQYQSSGAYQTLRDSGCIILPSQRTLRDYSHYTKAHSGFSNEADLQLIRVSKVDQLEEWQKCVILALDEMYIREDLVYDKHTGNLIGFCNLGDLNNHLQQLEKSVQESDTHSESDTQSDLTLAKSMLVIMVRGLFTNLQHPYAQFPCCDLKGDQIYTPFWEAAYRVERCSLKVLGATFDGASPNRKFLKMLQPPKSKLDVPYKAENPYTTENHSFYFFSDPPHLIKTTRNCWSSNTRVLWKNGKTISWEHLESLYTCGKGSYKEQPGLSIVPKLKYEHVHLNSFSRMRVDLAAQVLSNTVATALELSGKEEVQETAKFVKMFDKFFDCLNVGSFDSGKKSRNCFKNPYRSESDFRLKWLEETFIPYLDDWKKSVMIRKGFSDAEKKNMQLSEETLLGLRVTAHSFVDLVKYLFTLTGVKVFLSRRICQDPLEKFFGCQRQRGRTHDNPNVKEFLSNTQALQVVGVCRNIIKGNCRGNKDDVALDDSSAPLPKRKRQSQTQQHTRPTE